MIRLLIFLFLHSLAIAGVNPFVIFNTDKIKSSQSIIPLPQEQILSKDAKFGDVKLLLLAHETLYISSSSAQKHKINVQSSLDGKLFKKGILKQNQYKQYIFTNPFSQTMALKLQSHQEINASLYTTFNTSILNHLNPQAIALGKKPTEVMLSSGLSLQKYYSFHQKQKFSFELEGKGTLKLSLRAILHPLKNLSLYRQRIRVILNHSQNYLLDALNNRSLAYIEDANQTPLTADTTHFIPLEEGLNHIQIENNSPLLLSANFYSEHIINSLNRSKLQWKIPNRLNFINQAQWKNSSLDAGRKKMFALLKLKTNIYDSLQRKNLEIMAKKSIFNAILYPSTFALEDNLHTLNYAPSQLFLEDEYKARASIHPDYATAHLNSIRQGVFCRIPSRQKKSKTIPFEITQEQLYFNSNGFVLNKKLKRQVKTFLSHLKNYHKINLYGHIKRCQSIKSELIILGVPSAKVFIHKTKNYPLDETEEASNRRVEIKVNYYSTIKPYLEYTFDNPLEADTQIEFTIFSPKNATQEFYIQSYTDIKENKSRKYHLEYQKDTAFETMALSQSKNAFTLQTSLKNSPDKTIALLKNYAQIPFAKETATHSLSITKGTKSLRIWSTQSHKLAKISLSMPKSSTYKDTPFALSHHYAHSVKRFSKSLDQPLLQHFDAWYEHTHPLRLWFRSQISQAKINLSHTPVLEVSTLRYAKNLKRTHDRIASIQIAKQGLLRSSSANIQAQSFKLLLSLSQSPNEKLKWFANYFYRSGSPQILQEISTLLEKEGKYIYALNARLLLPHKSNNLQKICQLSLMTNNFVLYDALCNKKEKNINKIDYLAPKAKLINAKDILTHASSKAIAIKNCEGVTNIYSPQRDHTFPSYKATLAHPLEIEVQGPIDLEMNIQFATPHTNYTWLKIEHNNRIYHAPLTQFKASKGLLNLPDKQAIGSSNKLHLKLPKGIHHLRFHAYEVPLLFSLKGRYIHNKEIKPLASQVLKTSGYNPLSLLSQTPNNSLPYASALLWNYRYATLDYRTHAQAQAFLLSQETSNTQLKGIYSTLLKQSAFVSYATPQAPLGFYDVPVPAWHPSSSIEKNRLPLLDGIQDYALVLHGADYKIIHLEGEQNFRLHAKQFSTKYFPIYALKFAISCDGKPEKIISLDPKTLTWTYKFAIGENRHSIKIRLLDPLSTQYLAFKLYEDDDEIEQEHTKRYFASSVQSPIVIHEEGPKLLRIEEIREDNTLHTRYHFLEKAENHSIKILPTGSSQESLIHISHLEFDPLKKMNSNLSIVEALPLLFDEENFSNNTSISKLRALDDPYAYASHRNNEYNQSLQMPFESYTPTMSIGITSLNKEIGAEDEEDPTTMRVLQLHASLRMRLGEDIFLRSHYFTNLYDNPLYALEHKLSSQLPLFENLNLSLEANAYFQENNNYLFKAFQLKAQIYNKTSLSTQWSHKYGAGIFKYFLDFDNPNQDVLDPLVYSRYKRDHQQGIYGLYQLIYFPYDDLGFSFKGRLNSNEQFNIIDHAKMQVNMYHHLHPFDIKIHFDKYYYIEDRHRPKEYSLDRLGASVKFENFVNTHRLQLEATSNYNFSTENSQLSLSMIWYFSQNKRFYHFSSEEKIFNSLRLRLEDERE